MAVPLPWAARANALARPGQPPVTDGFGTL